MHEYAKEELRHSSIAIARGATTYNTTDEYQHPTIELPAIPDVAIHYRCGDNLNSIYGFLPFRVYRRRIPKSVRHVYIMAESPARKAMLGSKSRCARIFEAFQQFFAVEYPNTTVVVLRGQDMFDDYARLTFANITFCSISTFCFPPAIGTDNIAYFPPSQLIAHGRTDFDYGSSFRWLDGADEKPISGARVVGMRDNELVKLLMAP